MTDTKESVELFEGKEGPKQEYKLSKTKLSKDIWETVSAFSNTEGGTIFLGFAEEKGKFASVGVDNPGKILEDFSSTLPQKFNFCPVVKPQIHNVQNKNIITIEVEEAPKYQKPIFIKDAGPLKGGYKRIGSSDIRLKDEDVHRFFIERMGSPDSLILEDTTTDDLDISSLNAFKELRRLINPAAPELKFDDEGILKSYNLTDRKDKLKAACILLFGKEKVVREYFPAFRLDIIRIKGTKWGKDRDPFLSKDLIGNLFYLRSMAVDFVDRFFLVPFKSNEMGDRIDENAHRKTVREAITNLLMHQNYFNPTPSQVRIYNDRIEFYNPGYSLKEPELFELPGSKLRNPLISFVFYDLQWAETKGTGLKTTREELKKEGYPLPEYLNDPANDTFTLILPHPVSGVTFEDAQQVTDQALVQHKDKFFQDLMGPIDSMVKVVDFCKEPKYLKEIMAFINYKHRPTFVKKILKPLLDKRLIKMTIPGKPTSQHQKYVAVMKEKSK